VSGYRLRPVFWPKLGLRVRRRSLSPVSNWRRPLPRPIVLPQIPLTLSTIADVRDLVHKRLPALLRALRAAGHAVVGTDIVDGVDFLTTADTPPVDAIITNPPYGLAQEFIERALACAPLVAMLLRTDYDHAKTRQHLFGKCPTFAKKLVLTTRIVWFESDEAASSFNHAWYIWDQSHSGRPVLAYY